MTVENPNVKNTYAGNGSTTVFPFTFQLNPEDVNNVFVTLSNEEGTEIETTDFLLSLSDKSVRYPKRGEQPLSPGWKITIHRRLPYTQTLNLMSQGPFFAEDIEGQFDRQEMQIQQLAEAVDRCVKGSISGGKPPNVKIIEKHIEKHVHGGGSGMMSFSTIAELLENGVKGMSDGTACKTMGYHRPFDGGGANYLVRYLWSPSSYPWAIDLGATDETEYELIYRKDGTPEVDADGNYVLKKDAQGKPIPLYENEGHTPKKKHLYAVIAEKVVNYRQFGAKLDGATDDEKALRLCHQYQKGAYTIEPLTGRKHYTVRVENHEGIIRKDNSDPILCCGNIDLSGSKERKTKGQYKRLPCIRRGKPLFMRFSLLKADGIVFYAAPSFGGVFLRLDAFDNAMPEGTLALGS